MNMRLKYKLILVFMFIISLLFYSIINVFIAFDIDRIDKIDKKEGKVKEQFIEESIDYYTLPYVVSKNYSVFINFDSSFSHQRLVRPPPC